ncbi:hypothetical protein JZ751_016211 [Albula glossodonta]|uniref:Uncharacterized protein n=1 Tax=Albula glossodonta TaxID=121402 RepID=A0A8T2MVL6_9TELE|nr:hypothetical protein JZ751_003509 [Albula glossodonta]KAG9332024.1 hypothetical protein JZ751_016211 [Albula glossodonta]
MGAGAGPRRGAEVQSKGAGPMGGVEGWGRWVGFGWQLEQAGGKQQCPSLHTQKWSQSLIAQSYTEPATAEATKIFLSGRI